MNADPCCAGACAVGCLELIEVLPAYALCLASCYATLCGDPPDQSPVRLPNYHSDCRCTQKSAPVKHASTTALSK